MRPEDLYEAIGNTPDDLLERAADRMQVGVHSNSSNRNKPVNTRALTVIAAAVLAATLLLSAVMTMLHTPSPTPTPSGDPYTVPGTLPTPPVDPDQLPVLSLTAAEVGRIFQFNAYEADGETNQYVKVYADGVEDLNLSPLPDGEWLPILRIHQPEAGSGEAAFTACLDKSWAPLLDYLDIPAQAYELQVKDSYSGMRYEVQRVNNDTVKVTLSGDDTLTYMHMGAVDFGRIHPDGQYAGITKDTPEADIIALVADLRDGLNRVFGTNYVSPRIGRVYSYDGLRQILVDFYAPDSRILPGVNQVSSIRFSFEVGRGSGTSAPWDGSDGIAYLSTIKMTILHESDRERYVPVGKARRLTLAEAERELYAGHVFGGHSCPLCMAEQEKISFRGYSAVGFTYVSDESGLLIPFYTFYRYIGENEYGTPTYAMTYVCAVELSDYDDYYRSQEQSHR